MPIRMTCPGCQTPVAMHRSLAGKRARCPRCRTVFSTPEVAADADESEAIAVRPTAPLGAGANRGDAAPREPAVDGPHLWLEIRCEGCGHMVRFSASDIGMVVDCPECGEYIDVPE